MGLELAKANPALLGTVVLALGQLGSRVLLTRDVTENANHFFPFRFVIPN